MNYFNFKRRNLLSGPHLLGPILIIAGIIALLSLILSDNESSLSKVLSVGLGAIFLGLLIISSHGGTMIDFRENRFKEYVSLGGFKFGEWTELPRILSISVIPSSYMSRNTPNGISPTLQMRVTEFIILLHSFESKSVFSFEYSKKENAVKQAKILASSLNADLVIKLPELK